MTQANLYVQRLLEADPIRRPVLKSAIRSLHLPRASHGLDVGCGIGLQALQLAGAVGRRGHVLGLDVDADLIAYGERLVRRARRSEQISFHRGDMKSLPFAADAFDWAWSADCVGYPAGDVAGVLRELVRVVKPGGTLAILGWSSQQLLPGHARLEATLTATCSAYAPFLAGMAPELHFHRAPRWFQEAGLEEIRAQTFVGDVQAPPTVGQHTALTSLFETLWIEPKSDVDREESAAAWRESRRLCAPNSPDFILDQPGYYAFFTYTMFQAKVPVR